MTAVIYASGETGYDALFAHVTQAFTEVEVHAQTRTFSFASFDDYFSGVEAGSGWSGQEYLKLSADLRALVREDVRRSFPNNGNARPFVVEMEVLVGAGRK